MRVLKAYKKTVSIVDETAIELYKGLGREHKGFLMESNDKAAFGPTPFTFKRSLNISSSSLESNP